MPQTKLSAHFFLFFISVLLIQFAFSKTEFRETIHVIFRVTFILCFYFLKSFFTFPFNHPKIFAHFKKSPAETDHIVLFFG